MSGIAPLPRPADALRATTARARRLRARVSLFLLHRASRRLARALTGSISKLLVIPTLGRRKEACAGCR